MIVIRTSDGSNIHYRFGERKPALSVPQIIAIVHLTADGEELSAICDRMLGVPLAIHRAPPKAIDSMTWWGDHARFIVSNL